MNQKEAKELFQKALNEQDTISINKLKKLMQSLNMSLEPSESIEVKFLKNEIKKLNKENIKLNKKLRRRHKQND